MLAAFLHVQRWVAVCATVIGITACAPKTPGDVGSGFSLPQVRGGRFELRAHPARPILLAFLQTVPDIADSPSRSEVVSVMSMATQYRARGLTVAVIDASELVNRAPPDRGALINASYDWQLNVPLLEDRDDSVAQRFGVVRLPTVLLIARDGRIIRRWEGLTTPAELPFEVQTILGAR